MSSPQPNQEVQLSILHDHYKDSFSYLRDYIKLRDRLLAYALVALSFLFLEIASPDQSATILSDSLSKYVGLALSSPAFLRSLVWFLLLAVSTRYFQTSLLVEKQYPYIHGLEKQLNDLIGRSVFEREGENYLKNFPLFGGWAQFLYKWIFPALLLITSGTRIVREFLGCPQTNWGFIFDGSLFTLLTVTTVLYLIAVHNDPDKKKKS